MAGISTDDPSAYRVQYQCFLSTVCRTKPLVPAYSVFAAGFHGAADANDVSPPPAGTSAAAAGVDIAPSGIARPSAVSTATPPRTRARLATHSS